jgi:type I site-specific restriction endonuclease
MGIFDPDEVITVYSLQEAIKDGALVEIFKKRWKQLSDGRPIVASAHLVENVSHGTLRKIWNEFIQWKTDVESTLPEEERLFSTEIDGQSVWVIEEETAFILVYPEDY